MIFKSLLRWLISKLTKIKCPYCRSKIVVAEACGFADGILYCCRMCHQSFIKEKL